MFIEVLTRNIELTILTKNRLHRTFVFMIWNFIFFKLILAVLAFLSGMKLLLMLFFKIFIIIFRALCTFNDISSTISKMGGKFSLFYLLVAILTFLHKSYTSINIFIRIISKVMGKKINNQPQQIIFKFNG